MGSDWVISHTRRRGLILDVILIYQSAVSLKIPLAVPAGQQGRWCVCKRRSMGRSGGGSVTAGMTFCVWVGWCRFRSTIT